MLGSEGVAGTVGGAERFRSEVGAKGRGAVGRCKLFWRGRGAGVLRVALGAGPCTVEPAECDAERPVRRSHCLRCCNPDRDCLWLTGVAFRALLGIFS